MNYFTFLKNHWKMYLIGAVAVSFIAIVIRSLLAFFLTGNLPFGLYLIELVIYIIGSFFISLLFTYSKVRNESKS